MKQENEPTVQACIVDFAPEVLAKLLRLPSGVRITAVDVPVDRPGVLRARVEGMGWPVLPGQVIQTTRPIVSTFTDWRAMLDDDPAYRPVVTRVDWGCPLPAAPAPVAPVWCGCGDGIVPGTGARCGTCVMLLEQDAERARADTPAPDLVPLRVVDEPPRPADDPCPGCERGGYCNTFDCGRRLADGARKA